MTISKPDIFVSMLRLRTQLPAVGHRCVAAVTTLLTLLLLGSFSAAAEKSAGAFTDAIEFAQRRTVKVYGASIGLVSGYSTGIIVSPDGLIVTAQGIHLATDRLRVALHDGTMHDATAVRRNESLQLALLKINAETPDFFEMTKVPVAHQGDWVLAVSNAFKVADGPEPLSVHLGIVSLRTRLDARRRTQDFNYDGDFILIDAITSNPGAAGGAIVTADHRLAGMIGKIIESKSTNTRLNYAVPNDLIAQFVAGTLGQSESKEPVTSANAVLGIRLFRLGGRKAPAYIDRVSPGSPAAKAKLRPDDLIVSIAGQAVHDAGTYQEIVDTLTPNEEVIMIVKRRQQLLQLPITPDAEKQP